MRRTHGFTLTELIMVIVILSVVATISVRFIDFSARGAIDTAERQKLGLAGSVITERLSRELRGALPTSLRTHDNGRCIEFLPIQDAGRYQDVDLTESSHAFVTDSTPANPVTGRIVVYPFAGDVYEPVSPGVLSVTEATWESDTVAFNAPQAFAANSPERRFFVVGEPRTFCQQGRFLLRYSGYAVDANFNTGEATVFGAGLRPDGGEAVFAVDGPSLTRNALVAIELALESERSGETHTLAQEVQIRNVP